MTHILAMYDPPLTEEEIITISGLCGDIEISMLEKRDNNLLVYAYDYTFGGEFIGTFYRFSAVYLEPSMFLLGKQPIYMGRFDDRLERRCVELAVFCRHLRKTMMHLEEMSYEVKECTETFESLLDKPSEIDWLKISEVAEQFCTAFAAGHTKLEKIFNKQKYTVTI